MSSPTFESTPPTSPKASKSTDCSASPSCATSTMSPFRRGSLLASRLASGQCRKIEGSEELQRDEPGLSVPESRELPARNRVVPALHAPMFSWAQCGRAQVHARREVRTDPRGEPYLATRQVASTSTRRDHEEGEPDHGGPTAADGLGAISERGAQRDGSSKG